MDTSTGGFGSFYKAKFAASDLRRYRKKGPRLWTGALIEALKAEDSRGRRCSTSAAG